MLRPLALCALLALPAVALRIGGADLPAAAGLLASGTAVVASSFLLAWAAEAARVDISGPLAIAILAVIAVLPEYAVDLYFAHRAGGDPTHVAYAAANMTGSNRLPVEGVRAEAEEPELVGPAARIGALPDRVRRPLVIGLFVVVAAVILASAEPFATSLIGTGRASGVDEFLLVQWLAPLASEAPEFIVAVLFAVHGRGADAIGTLISSKVNQWTLLVGSLPVAYLLGGGGPALVLDARQVEEFLLTATQTVLGVAALLALRFPRWLASALLGLFALQFALPGSQARYALCVVYGALAAVALVRNRHHIGATFAAPFRRERQVVAPHRPVARAAGRG